ncbi:MAG: L,D-transpeptidase family protein [Gammaproteobacteria bacterium]|jgi:L,D-transpeptidase ErfK/SrfK
MKRSRVRTSIVVLLFAALAGCSGAGRQAPESASETVLPAGEPPIVSDRFLLQSPDQRIIGAIQVIETRYEDTFVEIARAYNLGFDELVDANPGVDPWLPGEGTQIILPTRFILPDAPREGIVINLASKRLFYYLDPDENGERAVVTYPIGIGQTGSATPVGVTTVTSKASDPVWFVPASIRAEYAAEGTPLPPRVMPGPDNPLGSHVLVLGLPSYLIHGTNRPAGVGMRVSHGCVRLFPENIVHLYEHVPVGEPVRIVNQPRLLAWEDGDLYLEAHQPLSDDSTDWETIFQDMLAAELGQQPNGKAAPDGSRTDQVIADAMGIPLPILAGSYDPAKILASAKLVNNLVETPPGSAETMAHETGT